MEVTDFVHTLLQRGFGVVFRTVDISGVSDRLVVSVSVPSGLFEVIFVPH